MTNEEAFPILKLFIEKSKKLENSNFVKCVLDDFRLGISIEIGKPMVIDRVGPNEENIEAFILTYRFFIQDNETISIRNLAKLFNSDLAKKDEQDRFNYLRNDLKSYLSESSNLNMYGEDISNRVLMDTFIYGGLSHAKKDKKQKYDQWMSRDEAVEDFFWHKFSEIIFQVFSIIRCINILCVSIIERISPQNKTA